MGEPVKIPPSLISRILRSPASRRLRVQNGRSGRFAVASLAPRFSRTESSVRLTAALSRTPRLGEILTGSLHIANDLSEIKGVSP